MNKKVELRDHVAGAIYGFVIGDSVGATTEFMSPDEIKAQYGEVTKQLGGGWLNLKPGEVTDDTQMMMCVIDALMKHYEDDVDTFKYACALNFSKWLMTDPVDVGNTCRNGIAHYITYDKFVERDEDSLGNGSLMRYLPCALMQYITGDSKYEEFNIAQGEITHNSSLCASLIRKTSKALFECLMGKYPSKDFEGFRSHLMTPSGCVTNTFNNAMSHATKDTFRKTLIESVNNGGDADTIAAIACSLAGAKCGLSGIDSKLIGVLDIEVKKKLGVFINFLVS